MFEFVGVKYKEILEIQELTIREGLTALVGPSGSGKTTALRLLNKMISPTAGHILYHGKDIRQINSVQHRRDVMMLSQTPVMFEGSIKDNLTIAFRFQEREQPSDAKLLQALERVHLRKGLDTPVPQLSGGERQRLALGRLFLCDPAVYILDEPSSALDDETEDTIISMVADYIQRTKKSAIMVTHSRSVAERYADEIIEIVNGQIRSRGDANERNR